MLKRFKAAEEFFAPLALAGADHFDRTRLFGLDLVAARQRAVVAALVEGAASGRRCTVQFVNAHCVNVLRRDPAYRAALDGADLLLPDGSGLAIAARLAGEHLGDNLNGTDLFPELCREAAARGQSIFLLGGRPGVAAATAAAMVERFPELRIAGSRDGFWNKEDEPGLIEAVNRSGAGIVLVALGVPLQECWIAQVRDRLEAPVVMGVGGLFDYYSGTIPRAPLLLRRAGCEWLWRLAQEPRRLFGRYVLGNPVFLFHAARHAWIRRNGHRMVSLAAKYALDRVMAVIALMVLAPVLLGLMLAIRIDDGGPVLVRQTRIGSCGRSFGLWRYRLTPRFGRVVKRLSLDELPQLFNILAGDMSFVGPRPALPDEAVAYPPAARGRLAGKPGLVGTRPPGRRHLSREQQIELDVNYMRTRSTMTDVRLLVRMIPAVFLTRSAA